MTMCMCWLREMINVSDRALAWLGAILPAVNFCMLVVLAWALRRVSRRPNGEKRSSEQ